MARELLIHIGLPKTGSTALQSFFSKNREALLKASIDYLPMGEFKHGKSGNIASGNGAYVARSILPPQDPAYLPWDDGRVGATFRAMAQNGSANKLLISSELFALPKPEAWNKLLELCRELDLVPTVIAVIRNQIDWLSSSYLQDVKRRLLTRDPIDHIRELYRSTRYLMYNNYFDELAKMTNGDIHLVSFDRHAHDGSLVREVLKSFNVCDLDVPLQQSYINVTPSPAEIAFLRICNRYGPAMHFSDILAISNAIDPAWQRDAADRWTVVDKSLAKEIESFFSEENRLLHNRFNLGRDFFSRPCENFIDINKISIDRDKMVSLFARYLVAYDSKISSLSERIEMLERAARTRSDQFEQRNFAQM
jgi:hypothetical protein